MLDVQRQLAMFEHRLIVKGTAKTMFGVGVINGQIEVTLTIEDKKNQEPPLDLNNIKHLVSEYITTTDTTDFGDVIGDIFDTVSIHYPGRDIEVMIYDTVERLTVMKIFHQPT